MKKVVKFRDKRVKKQKDEVARIKILSGPDRGFTFVILGRSATIGRGETNDIVLSDLRMSRNHAKILQGPTGWEVVDNGSSNGIIVNGKTSRRSTIRTDDVVQLGETQFQFFTESARTLLLEAPIRDSSAVAVVARDKRIEKYTRFGGGKKKGPSGPQISYGSSGGSETRKKVLYGVVLITFAWLMFSDDEPVQIKSGSKRQADKKVVAPRNLAQYLPDDVSPEVKKSADMFFKVGFREFREKNYLRARKNFETVLQIHPGHKLGRLYLDNCNKEIENEVKFHMERGKKSLGAGKLRESKGHFEAVLRLLYKDQNNPAFAEAREQLDKVKDSMKGKS